MSDSKPLLVKWRMVMQAARDPSLSASCLRVLPAVLDRMNMQFECWPGYGRIAQDAGVDRRTATRAVQRLVDLGYLDRQMRGKGISNKYRLGKVVAALPIPDSETSGSSDMGTVGSSDMGVVAAVTPEPEKRTRIREPKSATGSGELGLPHWLPADKWQQFQDHRKHIKKPMTDNAKRLSISKLTELKGKGNDPGEVLDQSIMNGWTGLYPIKADERKPNDQPTPPSQRYLN